MSYPDWEDMKLSLIDYLRNTDKKVILLQSSKKSFAKFKDLPKNISQYYRFSLIGMYHMITSKVIFITHGSFLRKLPKRTVIINLWHGFGFKAVGTYLGFPGVPSSKVISSSEFTKPFFAKEMDVINDDVVSLGFVRNDRLINSYNDKDRIIKRLSFDSFQSIIIWLPTFRQSIEGDIRVDGVQYDNPFNLLGFEFNKFVGFLEENNILLIFRAHPMSLKFDIKESKNFKIANDEWLFQNGLSLYQLLGITDILISDVSSVITDYLLINKPIIHAMSDFDEYLSTRPILLNPSKDYLVGPFVDNQNKLTNEIENILNGNDMHSEIRLKMKNLFFDNNDDNQTAKRIFDYLSKL